MTKKNKKRILWVDDDSKGFLRAFGELIEQEGHDLESVVSIDLAIYLLQNESYNIVITDWLLPFRPNAFEIEGGNYLIQKIRDGSFGENLKKIPIIILSIAKSDEIRNLAQDEDQKKIYYFDKTRIVEREVFDELIRVIEES